MRKRTIDRELINRNRAVRNDALSLEYSRKQLCNKYGISITELGCILISSRYDEFGKIQITAPIVERNIAIAHFLYSLDITQKKIGNFIQRSNQQVSVYLQKQPTAFCPALCVKLISEVTGKMKAGLVLIREVGREILLQRNGDVCFLPPDGIVISVDGLTFDGSLELAVA